MTRTSKRNKASLHLSLCVPDILSPYSCSHRCQVVEAIGTNLKLSSKLAEKPPNKEEPYTSERALALFSTYADPDEPNVIGPEGFEKLCQDSGLPMDGPVPLLLAWQVEAKEMAKISKEEWTKGSKSLRCVFNTQFPYTRPHSCVGYPHRRRCPLPWLISRISLYMANPPSKSLKPILMIEQGIGPTRQILRTLSTSFTTIVLCS